MSKKMAAVLQGVNNVMLCPLGQRQRKKTLSRYLETMGRQMVEHVPTSAGNLKILAHKSAFVASSAQNFHKDEPETLEWIDTYIQENDVMWDIGANIGLYSLYAAQTKKANVFAFEPFGVNFGLLIEHIFINGLDKYVSPLCVALGETTKLENLHMRGFEAGVALNAVGNEKNQFGDFDPVMSQATLLMRPEDLCKVFGVPAPDHVKLDVDSIETEIVRGLQPLLPQVKTITVEVEGENAKNDGAEIANMIVAAGLVEIPEHRTKGHCRNRLWVRN